MIDLLNDQVAWETRQILKRGEALVRSQVSQDEELILNRKLQGVALGVYTLSPEEQALLAQFQAVTLQAQQAVAQARADNALLVQILDVEQAERAVAKLTLLIEGRAEAWLPVSSELLPGVMVQLPDGRVGEVLDTDELFDPEPKTTIDVRIDADTDVLDVDASTVTPVVWQEAIEPLAPAVDTTDEQGNPVTVDNPAYLDAVSARDAAQAVLDNASAEVMGWVEQRR